MNYSKYISNQYCYIEYAILIIRIILNNFKQDFRFLRGMIRFNFNMNFKMYVIKKHRMAVFIISCTFNFTKQ